MTQSRRGFAGMSPEKRIAIAAKGGRSIPDHKRSFSKDPELARAAGSKGGLARGMTGKSVVRLKNSAGGTPKKRGKIYPPGTFT